MGKTFVEREEAIGYGRVSTTPQDVGSQVYLIKDYAQRNGICLRKIYTDEGFSGRKVKRPGLNEVLTVLRSGEVKTLIVAKLDRAARSLPHMIDLLSEFRNRKIRLIAIMDNVDTGNTSPMMEMFWKLLALFGEFEADVIRERVRCGLARAKAEGKRLGRPPGSVDKRRRSVSGYQLRYAKVKKEKRKLGKRKEG